MRSNPSLLFHVQLREHAYKLSRARVLHAFR